ncbi:Phage-related minor tail protein [Serratia fonticola]|jgi:lambda family phage tail tape measure protein|uniref:phage tail tape measure protein n=1 Tax=Serratia fonticola TaxID=47917 RepID=UPI0021787D85|nr:phage tail tape measure protein [Serratia fonticola]CAI0982280.1 Phage-related minor tail protein [Serratia fonticola]
MADITTMTLRVNASDLQRANRDLVDLQSNISVATGRFEMLNRTLRSGMQEISRYSNIGRQLSQLGDSTNAFIINLRRSTAAIEEYRQALEGMQGQASNTASVSGSTSGDFGWKEALDQGSQLVDTYDQVQKVLAPLGRMAAPVALTVGSIALLGTAYYQGAKESEEFNRQLILTGNYAGKSSDQLQDLARKYADLGGGMDTASETIAKIVGTGAFSGEQIDGVTKGVLALQQATGQTAEQAINAYKKIFTDPITSAYELNKAYNYLSVAEFEHILQLEEQGKVAEASDLIAQKTAITFEERANKLVENLGYIDKAVRIATSGWDSFWNMLKGIGRDDTLSEQLDAARLNVTNVKNNLEKYRDIDAKSSPDYGTDSRLIVDKKKIISDAEGKVWLLEQVVNLINDSSASTSAGNVEQKLAIEKLKKEHDARAALRNKPSVTVYPNTHRNIAQNKVVQTPTVGVVAPTVPDTQELLKQSSSDYIKNMSKRQRGLVYSAGKSNRIAQREASVTQFNDEWIQKGGKTSGEDYEGQLKALTDYHAAEDKIRGSWLDGAQKGWNEYLDSATNVYDSMANIGQATFSGLSDMLTSMVTTGKANFQEFTASILKMIIQVINQLLVAFVMQKAMGWIGGAFTPAATGKSSGGYTGDGGKYDQAGVVHRGEFVMTKEATQRIGVGNLYAMMRGYADGGLVGGNKAPMYGLAAEQGGGITVNSTVVMNNDGSANAANSSSAGDGMGKLVQGIVNQAITERLGKELKPGGLIWNASAAR